MRPPNRSVKTDRHLQAAFGHLPAPAAYRWCRAYRGYPRAALREVHYQSSDLEYFRRLLSGEEAGAWHKWWPANEARLKAALPRPEYLKLKFNKLEHVASVLRRAGILFNWSVRARVASRFADMDPRKLDESGIPLESHWIDVFGSLVSAFEFGQVARGRRLTRGKLARALTAVEPATRGQELGEWEMAAELLYEAGHQRAAIGFLRVIAEIPEDDDLIAPAIQDARQFLRKNESKGEGDAEQTDEG